MKSSQLSCAVFLALVLILQSVIAIPAPPKIIQGASNVEPSKNEIITSGFEGAINTYAIRHGLTAFKPLVRAEMEKEFNNYRSYLTEPVPGLVRGVLDDLLAVGHSAPIPKSYRTAMETLNSNYRTIIESIHSALGVEQFEDKGIDAMVDATVRGVQNYLYIKQRRPQMLDGDIPGVPQNGAVIVDRDSDGESEEIWFDAQSSFSEEKPPVPATTTERPSTSSSIKNFFKKTVKTLSSWEATRQATKNAFKQKVEKLIRSIVRETNTAIHNLFSQNLQETISKVPESVKSILIQYIPAEYLQAPLPGSPDGPTEAPKDVRMDWASFWSKKMGREVEPAPRRGSRQEQPSTEIQEASGSSEVSKMFINFKKAMDRQIVALIRSQMEALETRYKDIAATIVREQIDKMFSLKYVTGRLVSLLEGIEGRKNNLVSQ